MSSANMSKFNESEHHVVETPKLSFEHISQNSKADSRKRDSKQARTRKPAGCSVSSAKKYKFNNETIETSTDDLYSPLVVTDSDSDDIVNTLSQSSDLDEEDDVQQSSSTTTESDGSTTLANDSESDKELSTDVQEYPIWVRDPEGCSGRSYVKVMGRFVKSSKNNQIGQIYRVYGKYFNKFAYDTTVVLGHVLHALLLSSGYYRWRQNVLEGTEGSTETIAYEQFIAKMLHSNRYDVMTAKVRTYFAAVVYTFDDSDFKLAFRIFVNCLLTIVRSLQGNVRYTRFKLVQLLCSCLKKRVEDWRAWSLLNSNRFVSDCSDIADVVDKARQRDQHAQGNMLLLSGTFPWVRICIQHFQPVISIVFSPTNVDLESAITKAANDISLNSTFVNNKVRSVSVPE